MLNKTIVKTFLSLFCLRHGFQRPARFISDNECGYVPVPESPIRKFLNNTSLL